jgi:membrane-bound lytic murein transglycosylase D
MNWWWILLFPIQWSDLTAAGIVSESEPAVEVEAAEEAVTETEQAGGEELEKMAEAEAEVFSDRNVPMPDRNEFSCVEGLEDSPRETLLRQDKLQVELGTGASEEMESRWMGATLSARGSREKGFDIPVVINESVERWIAFLQLRTPEIFSKWLARTTRYYPVMRPILKQYGLPEDLMAVALIESGLQYAAFSRAHASGPWQFIKSTGSTYGLKSDFWIDERRDIVKATDAAARHLRDLYRHYNDWYLAWAAYNAGAGWVDRAIERLNSRDFWELATAGLFRNETKGYVPKIIAAAIIQKDPEKFGFGRVQYLEPLQWDEVEVEGMADLKAAASATGVTLQEIQELNPELKFWCSPPYMKSYRLRVPKGTLDRFHKSYNPSVRDNRTTFVHHRVRSGETLGHIAIAYRTSVEALMSANHISNPRRVGAGKPILVPIQPCGTPVQSSPKQNQKKMAAEEKSK